MIRPDRPAFPSRRESLGLALVGLLGAGVASVTAPERGRLVWRPGIAFGTTVSIGLVDDGSFGVEDAFAAAFAAIRAVQKAADLFDPGSELARLNRDGRLARPSRELTTLVAHGLRLADATGGAFDPTVQPLWLAWSTAGGDPTEADLAEARARVDHRAVRVLDDEIRFTRPGMAMTLNALAQGYATDRVSEALSTLGVAHAFLDTGELGARGARPEGRPWRVAIADPRNEDGTLGRIDLAARRFLATSSDDRTTWRADFSEHHIVEPWSGHSPTELAQVVVEAGSGLVADGLSTAVMVSGVERGSALVAATPDTSALLVDKRGRRTVVGRFPPFGA